MLYNFATSVYGVNYRSWPVSSWGWTFWSCLLIINAYSIALWNYIVWQNMCITVTTRGDYIWCIIHVRNTCVLTSCSVNMWFVSLLSRRANLWRGEPVRRRVRQWATPAQRHTVKNSGAGSARDQTLRYKPATPSLPRLREQDFGEVQRDGLHLTRCHRWKQTTGHDA